LFVFFSIYTELTNIHKIVSLNVEQRFSEIDYCTYCNFCWFI